MYALTLFRICSWRDYSTLYKQISSSSKIHDRMGWNNQIIRLLFTMCCFAVFTSTAVADERILSFHSDIHILPDSSMKVSETITVRAEGKKIRRGIYRDFPTSYKDRLGNRYRVGFTIDSIKRDGYSEDYHIKAQSNGIRIYFGNKDKMLGTGEFTYKLTYHTNRQLGFF